MYVHKVRIGLADVIFVPGIAVQAIHYLVVSSIFNQVPVVVIIGQPNTGKSLLGKIGAVLVGGVHRVAVYSSQSSSKLEDLLGKSLSLSLMILSRKCLQTLIAKGLQKYIDCMATLCNFSMSYMYVYDILSPF